MYSENAQRALAPETIGKNSVHNFSSDLEPGKFKSDKDIIRKTGLLPDKIVFKQPPVELTLNNRNTKNFSKKLIKLVTSKFSN